MNAKEQFVITISREIGSGGRTVGRLLAERLGVRYSDKDLIAALRDKFQLTEDAIERLKGEKKNWLSDVIHLVAPMAIDDDFMRPDRRYPMDYRPDLTPDDIYAAESDILREIAAESSCVIAGRSASFVLKDCPNKMDVFITGSREHRLRRVMEKQALSREKAEEVLDSVDRARDNYVQRFTGLSRYDSRHYDLVINMDPITEEEAVGIILSYCHANG